ncbi:MAG TPA: phage portal protein [Schlesneria sp.]
MSSLDAWSKLGELAHSVADRGQKQLSYDAIQSGKRRLAANNLRSEDNELISPKRKQLLAQTRDVMRNIAIARWAVGKHNDFVSRLSFASKTGLDFDYEVEARMREWMNNPTQCDIRKQHTFARILRMAESRAVLDGDHLLIRCKGRKIQQIESDRIRTAKIGIKDRVVHGCRQDQYGATTAYQVHSRGPNGYGYEYQGDVPAEHCMFHAYYPSERADQTRGVGLMVAGINNLIDAYEWEGSAKATEKARAIWAAVFKTSAAEGIGEYTDWGNKYSVKFGDGPQKLELDKDDTLEFMSSDTPGGNTVAFFNACIGIGLKALDLPLCFYDETLTNFFGQRAQFILYIESCKSKRDNLRTNILFPLTKWLLRCWVADGTLKLPAGLTGTTLNRFPYQWRPAGIPWWNPLQEVTAQLMAIRGGLANYEDTYLEVTGQDWFENIDRLAEQQAYINKKGVILDQALAAVMAATLIGQQQQQDQSNPLASLPVAGQGMAL